MEKQRDYSAEGEASYREWRDLLRADPEYQQIYEEEAAKSDLWLQLFEISHLDTAPNPRKKLS